MKKKMQRGLYDVDKDDPFELFISATQIRYTYYSESHKILGNTYGMCVLQVRRGNHSVMFAFSLTNHLCIIILIKTKGF